jgi:DNA-binding beta-propeller fold protein YncE
VLAAGCAANAAAPAGAPSGSASASPTLPDPFTITAQYTAKSLGLNHPDALAIGPDGNLYVTDISQRVTVISPAGKVLRRWGKRGHRPGEFDFITFDPTSPTDVHGKIAIGPDAKVYVSDSGNGRVQVFTPQGRFIREFGSFGSGKGQFLKAFDLEVDKAGDVYVSDVQDQTLTKFSPAGKAIWQIGGPAEENPDLAGGDFHLASIDVHGRLVVVNDGPGMVLYLDPGGHVVDAFSPDASYFPDGQVCEATVDPAGDTYVTGCGLAPVIGPTLVYNAAHKLIAEWPGTPYSLLRSPVFGPHREVFALATNGTILKLHAALPGA